MNSPEKFRKKPVVIEAWQFRPEIVESGDTGEQIVAGSGNGVQVAEWCGGLCHGDAEHDMPSTYWLTIETLEGTHRADRDDFIIKGVKGEFYPCKPDIFEATYEKVTNAPSQ